MGNAEWKMKVAEPCPDCHGQLPGINTCQGCGGTGKVIEEVPPPAIESFLTRPEYGDYRCICGKRERILRPREGQIPTSWIQWGHDLLCVACRNSIVTAAIMEVGRKIASIKEMEKTK